MTQQKKFRKINNAVIDLGSNSIRMLIFRRDKNGRLFQVNRSLRYTKLAQDLSRTGKLSADAMQRNLEALEEFQGIARDYDVHHVYLFATSAMRDAQNSAELAEAIKARFGLDVHVINGEQEAAYGFTGVSQCYSGPVLVFDIGGASTELMYGDRHLENAVSLRLGCVRSSESYIADQNAVRQEEIRLLFDAAYATIKTSLETFDLPETFQLVGIGGTITTLASIVNRTEIYDSTTVHGTVLEAAQIERLLGRFIRMTNAERCDIVGLSEKRADTIIAGTVIALAVLKASGKAQCTVCDYDNMDGAAYAQFFKTSPKTWDHQNYKKPLTHDA